jgi:endonuclease/exonuclease/phosphatase family metal-dependent hydrolase
VRHLKGLLELLPAFVVAALTAMLSIVAPATGSAYAATGQAKTPSDRLQVWNLNTAGMATAPASTDYREFVDYITDPTRVAYVPDIVTLQEAGTNITGLQNPSCHNFEYALEARTGFDYFCYETTKRGGAAVVYRTGRLSFVGGTLRSVQLKERATQGASCDPSSWYALVLRFKDDLNAGKYSNVASVHLPYSTDNSDADCAWENMKTVNSVVDSLGSASMRVMAGDWNHTDGILNSSGQVNWECWYSGTNGDLGLCGSQSPNLGWKDAMYRACNLTGTAAYNCLHTYHWTHGDHARLDYLFAKTYAIYNQVTVDWTLAYQSAGSPSGWPTRYSDHRGQGALLRYY